MKKIAYITALTILFALSSCNTTEKILKSNDSNLKFTKAMEWYNKGQYFKAIPVFEELMGLFKGEKSTEEIYFYYCMAHFKQKSYLVSAFHFKNYTQKHPYSKYAEEALYMHAESYYKQTLDYSLDQTETINSIDAYQTFINTHPSSERIRDANIKIDLLREKLELKAFKAAELYYKTKNFRAAAISFKNLLIDYPDIDGVEDIQSKIVRSYFQYAEQSVAKKQAERYNESIKAANNFLNRYPNNDIAKQIEKIREQAHLEIIKTSFESALVSAYTKRISTLREMPEIYNTHISNLSDEKNIETAKKYLERSYFQKVKTEYLMAQDSKLEKKAEYYKAAVEAYNEFSSKYSNSKYQNEAKRILNASEKNFKKYSNG